MYFFDTYALVEIVKGNKNYESYKSIQPTCSIFNLFELHQALLREFNKQTADYWIKKFNYSIIDATKEDIIAASDFRFKNKNKNLSSIDCIGYVLSLKHNLKFLTGDKQFENFENAEFVK